MKRIFWGAGKNGRDYATFLEHANSLRVIDYFCDAKYEEMEPICGIEVISPQVALEKKDAFFYITIADSKKTHELEELLGDKRFVKIGERRQFRDEIMKIPGIDRVSINREWCAWFHVDHMDSYYENAEAEESLNIFWGKDSIFLKMFNMLDLSKVIELACGRGRHVPQYIDKAGEVLLVDIVKENIILCEERFKSYGNKIKYYRNNGYNLSEIGDTTYSSLFTYDAMVHFEMMDIYEYLRDIYRVLIPGGKALFHHSNNTSDYKQSFYTNPRGRNYMSKDLFAYMAYRVGFEIEEQHEIDWGTVEDGYQSEKIDCVTLVKKPLE